MKYGLNDACFDDLEALRKMYPDELSDKPKRNRPSQKQPLTPAQTDALLDKADAFLERHGITIAEAVKKVLANGWPASEQRILDMYRNSEQRQINVVPMFQTTEIKAEDENPAKQTEVFYDYCERQGPPTGPRYCDSYRQYIEEILVPIANWMASEHGDWFDDPSARIPPFSSADRKEFLPPHILNAEDVTTKNITSKTSLLDHLSAPQNTHRITIEEIADDVKIPPAIMERIITEASHLAIFPYQIKALRRVEITLPIDCPEEIRNSVLDQIVYEWKELRNKAGYDYKPRNRYNGLIADMKGLVHRIEELRKTKMKPESSSQYPDGPSGKIVAFDENIDTEATRSAEESTDRDCKKVLSSSIIKVFKESFPSNTISDKDLYNVIIKGIERASEEIL